MRWRRVTVLAALVIAILYALFGLPAESESTAVESFPWVRPE